MTVEKSVSSNEQEKEGRLCDAMYARLKLHFRFSSTCAGIHSKNKWNVES